MLRKAYRLRIKTLYFVPFLFAALLVPRLYYLQVVKSGFYFNKAKSQHSKTISVVPSRGSILDTNGTQLASSTPLKSPWIVRKYIPSDVITTISRELATALDLDARDVAKTLTTPTKYMNTTTTLEVALAHKLDPDSSEQIREIFAKYADGYKVMGQALYFKAEGKRLYPREALAAPVIGYTVTNDFGDNKGRAGIEMTYDEVLRGEGKKYSTRVNASRDALDPMDSDQLFSTYGNDIVLTIDEQIQGVAQAALARRVEEMHAAGGAAVVYGIKTGEVLAMASYPTFDLGELRTAPDEVRHNKVIESCNEPGSVMKIFTFASVFEEGKVSPEDPVNCMGGKWATGQRVISDVHAMGVVPAKEVFAESSNIGTVKIASSLTQKQFYTHLRQFGFGEPTGIDLPFEIGGRLSDISKWSSMSMSSLPIGYELQVTAMQVVAAAAAIVNDGYYMQPHIVKEIRDFRGNTITKIEPKVVGKVVSSSTSRKMRALMELVVTHGTGKGVANLDNYRAGGKTGTTKKIDKATHKYASDRYIASFCGVAPMEDPEICVYVWIDDPLASKGYYGGKVAAPVFKQIAEPALKILKIPATSGVSANATDLVQKEKGSKQPKGSPANEKPPSEMPSSEVASLFDRPSDEDDTVCTGSMPNLEGLTMLEAKEKLKSLNVVCQFSGSGVAIEQEPKKFETVERGQIPVVKFVPMSEFLAKRAKDPSGDDSAGTGAEAVPAPRVMETPSLQLVKSGKSVPLPLAPGAKQVLVPDKNSKQTAKAALTPVPDLDQLAAREPVLEKTLDSWATWKKEPVKNPVLQKRASDPTVKSQTQDSEEADANDKPLKPLEVPQPASEETINSLYDVIGKE